MTNFSRPVTSEVGFAVVRMQNFGQKRGRWSLKRGGRLIQ